MMEKSSEILNKMTREQKAQLLCGVTPFGTFEAVDIGLPKMIMTDGGTGVNFDHFFAQYTGYKLEGYTPEELNEAVASFYDDKGSLRGSREQKLHEELQAILSKVTGDRKVAPGCYPPGILLGSTWNEEVIRKVGRMVGLEAKLFGVDLLLGTPNVNLLRDPHNGRFFEGWSEDPYLTSSLAPNLTIGIDEEGVGTNVKHFACNNLEFNRIGINEIISERALEQMYYPQFEATIKAGVSSVMAAYPAINGTTCTMNSNLLRDVLGNMGFTGFVMSDWGACTSPTGSCIAAGTDLAMPGPWPYEDVVKALDDGRLSETRLDEACGKVLDAVVKYAIPENKVPSEISDREIIEAGDKAAYEAACEGIVMLRNRNSLFPLDCNSDIKISIIDNGRDGFIDCGGGSAGIITNRKSTLFDNLKGRIREDKLLFNDIDSLESGDIAVVTYSVESAEGTDREELRITDELRVLLKGLAVKRSEKGFGIALVLNVPGPITFADCEDIPDAIFCVWYPGMSGAKALADIMTGIVSPSGKLTVTFPRKEEDLPSFLSFPDNKTAYYGEGVFVGYRGFEMTKREPLFGFGFGLSYTSFAISDVRILNDELKDLSDKVTVSFVLKNKGNMAGSEVVQLYSGDPVSTLRKPRRELRAFTKRKLLPGQSEVCKLSFSISDLMFYDEDFSRKTLEDGFYNLYLGTSLENAAQIGDFYVPFGDYKLGLNSTVLTISKIPELFEKLRKCLREADADMMPLNNAIKYTPFLKLNEIPEIASRAEKLLDFTESCERYIKP